MESETADVCGGRGTVSQFQGEKKDFLRTGEPEAPFS